MARIPLGITMSFLITSPLINEIAIVLLWDLLGWKFTIIYVAVGVFAGILSGIVMDAIHAKRWLRPSLLGTIRNMLRSIAREGGKCGINNINSRLDRLQCCA